MGADSRRPPTPDHCQDCGICCFARGPHYIRLFTIDLERLRGRHDDFVDDLPGGAALRFERADVSAPTPVKNVSGKPCTALSYTGGRFTCGIYQARPDACRALERGSSACHEHIAEKGAALKRAQR